MNTRIEYAVQYTGVKHGKIRTLIEEPTDPTDYQAAQRLLDHTLSWQEHADKRLRSTPDAAIVTRTVRTSDWQTEDVARAGAEATELAEASRFQDALNALATFVIIYEPCRKQDSEVAKSLLRYVLVDSRRSPAEKYVTEIKDELWAWAGDEGDRIVELVRAQVSARR